MKFFVNKLRSFLVIGFTFGVFGISMLSLSLIKVLLLSDTLGIIGIALEIIGFVFMLEEYKILISQMYDDTHPRKEKWLKSNWRGKGITLILIGLIFQGVGMLVEFFIKL